ncbi:hypothetical protein [Streptomyces sp. NPDC006552]|uniref:hypothetical protein n=1 Tax=Streptomyces sp. NPDC006552 TaxID=3157179 RepID=UPI0033B70A19
MLIVEPDVFRTGVAVLRPSAALDAYQETVGPVLTASRRTAAAAVPVLGGVRGERLH